MALGYVLDGRLAPDLLVLSAPALQASIPLWQRVVVQVKNAHSGANCGR